MLRTGDLARTAAILVSICLLAPALGAQSFTILHSFSGWEGKYPAGGLTLGADGIYYGIAGAGGSGYGTIFRMEPSGRVTNLYSWPSPAVPQGPPLRDSDGNLFGVTGSLTPQIFELDSGNNYSTLHVFTEQEGFNPNAPLIEDGNGNLYGTTASSIFKLDTSNQLTILAAQFPTNSGLVRDAQGNLYASSPRTAMTPPCFGLGLGGAWELNTLGNLQQLGCIPGSLSGFLFNHLSALIRDSAGSLYGVSEYGGTSNGGVIYKVSGDTLTILHSFSAEDVGPLPASLVRDAHGNLFGTTSGGGAEGHGTVFRLDTHGMLWTLHSFTSAEGSPGSASLVIGNDANLYGTTWGSVDSSGTVFRVFPCNSAVPVMTVSRCFPPVAYPFHASIPAIAGYSYAWTVSGGTMFSGQGTSDAVFSSGAPGTRMTIQVVVTDPSGCSGGVTEPAQVDFADVPASSPIHDFVCTVGRDGITAGCGGGDFCPSDAIRRDQMSVFLLLAEHGAAYVPAPASGIFADVPASNPFAPWIEQVYHEGISAGCGTIPLTFCPAEPVTRASIAVSLLRAKNGPNYTPPSCVNSGPSLFADVPCPGPFTDWIDALYAAGITGGCSTNPLRFCPEDAVTRGQMAVFLSAAFSLP